MKQARAKSVILGILFAIFLFSLSVATTHAQWAYTYGGTKNDYVYSVHQTQGGGYIVAAETYSFGAGNYDFLIFKLDSDGGLIWEKTYGGSSNDHPFSIQPTADGGYIVAGQSNSFGAGDNDILLLKLDSVGNVEWQKTYGGTADDTPNFVQQTSDGGYIVIGSTNSFGAGSYDVWLLKLNSSGDVTWQKTYGGTGAEFGIYVRQTGDDGFIAAGYFNGGSYDVWLLKLNSSGDVTWQKTYGGTGAEFVSALQQTVPDGGYIVGGFTESFGAGNRDAWLLKLNSSGDVTWQKTYGGGNVDTANAIQQTSDGGYIVAGNTTSFGAGEYNAWIFKLNSDGNINWQKTYGGSQTDGFNSIQQTSDGGYIVAGNTTSFGAGEYDIWLLKLDSNGSIGSCPFEGISTASVTDTAATVIDTSVTPITSTATTTNTTATVTDTNVSPNIVCSASLGLERLKVGSSNKKHGEGTVTSREGLIACPDSCQAEYTEGFNVTLLATPSALSTFLGWKPTPSGCETTNPVCQVTMDQKKSVKAVFQGPNKLKVVATFKNGATGSVTSGDALVNCPGDCEELYILNAPVTLTANEGVGSSFVKWTGKPCKDESTNLCTFTMEKNATVKALFEPTP
jgi:uncharacterized delta-60 repeat protein